MTQTSRSPQTPSRQETSEVLEVEASTSSRHNPAVGHHSRARLGSRSAAAQAAISSPLLEDASIEGARGILINITGGADMTLYEINEAAEIIQRAADPDAEIIFGCVTDERMTGSVKVTVIPTAITGDSGDATAQSSATNTGNTGSASSAANSTPLATSGGSGATGSTDGRRASSGDSGHAMHAHHHHAASRVAFPYGFPSAGEHLPKGSPIQVPGWARRSRHRWSPG